MKTIGITGGVGAGKSKILAYIQTHCNCRILLADEAAHKVREPGNPCYNALVRLLGTDTLEEDGQINRQKMAAKIFADHKLLEAINAVIHPAVKAYILQEIEAEREAGKIDAFFVEAALLIEEGYGELLDEHFCTKRSTQEAADAGSWIFRRKGRTDFCESAFGRRISMSL